MIENLAVKNLIIEIKRLIKKEKLKEASDKCKELLQYTPNTYKMKNTVGELFLKLNMYEEIVGLYSKYGGLEKRNLAFQTEIFDEELLIANQLILEAFKGMEKPSWLIKRQFVRCSMIAENIREVAVDSPEIMDLHYQLLKLEEENCLNPLNKLNLMDLAKLYFTMLKDNESLMCFIIYFKLLGIASFEDSLMEKSRLGEMQGIYEYLLNNFLNMPLICREFLNFEYPLIFIKDSDLDFASVEVVATLFSKLKKEVWLIEEPLNVESETAEIDCLELTNISFENITINNNVKYVKPINLIYNNEQIDCNLDQILIKIKNLSPRDYCTVLCSSYIYEILLNTNSLKKEIYKTIEPLNFNLLNKNMAIGHIGDYLEFVKQLYGEDVVANIEKPAETKISIVIPCRNTSVTLEYTLETCLNQNFEDYEIVISDNSTRGTEIQDLIKKINNDKIKYYKTPYDLPLSRSFEFAFLQAKGEFIFSIGSDDGVCFHGLNTISKIMDDFPKEDIIQWERGFYIWPNFNLSGQQGQYIIPNKYDKNNITVFYYDTNEMLNKLINEDLPMYGMPSFYINSGFRRRYFKKILRSTGRLWDGYAQDVYMGIVNLELNEKILNLNSCITFAGMSSLSLGGKSMQDVKLFPIEDAEYEGNGYALPRNLEKMIFVFGDKHVFLTAIMKVNHYDLDFKTSLGDLKQRLRIILEEVPTIYDAHSFSWEYCAKNVLNLALNQDPEIYEWLLENVIKNKEQLKITPEILENIEEKKHTKAYEEEFLPNGGRILDSRKYGITNIFEACELFKEITGL